MKAFLQKQIKSLQKEAISIRVDMVAMDALRSRYYSAYDRSKAKTEYHVLAMRANTSYSKWFQITLQLVRDYQADHEKAFTRYANTVMTFLKYSIDKVTYGDEPDSTALYYSFDRQIGIINAIPRIIELREADLQTLINAEFIQDELAHAEVLLKKKYLRCAGLLCGVALERHLQQLCRRNGIDPKTARGIDALAQRLYKRKVINKIQLKQIKYLASIRNTCAHPNEDTIIKEREIEELFQKASALVLIH